MAEFITTTGYWLGSATLGATVKNLRLGCSAATVAGPLVLPVRVLPSRMATSTTVPVGQVRLKARAACMGMAHGRERVSHRWRFGVVPLRPFRAVGHRAAQSKKACAVSASLCFTSRNHTYKWWPGRESNPRHRDFQSLALPTELPGHCTRGQADVRGGMIRGWGLRGKPPVR